MADAQRHRFRDHDGVPGVCWRMIDGTNNMCGRGASDAVHRPPGVVTLRNQVLAEIRGEFEGQLEAVLRANGESLTAAERVAAELGRDLGVAVTFEVLQRRGWLRAATGTPEDGLTAHCGRCGHRRGPCGGPGCPCRERGA